MHEIQEDEQKNEQSPSVSGTMTTALKSRSLSRLFGAGGIVLFFLVGAVAYMAQESMPGDPLYGVKTRITEPSVALLKVSTESRIAYRKTLMERRLHELGTLSHDNATTSEETLGVVSARIGAHTTDTLSLLADSKLSSESKIQILTSVAGLSAAQDQLVRNTEEFTSMRDAVGAQRKEVGDALDQSIEAFVAEAPQESVQAHLAAHIESVSQKVAMIAPGSEAHARVRARMADAHESLLDGDTAAALDAVLRAESAIAVDGYLWGSERGEGEIPPPAPVTTEGQ